MPVETEQIEALNTLAEASPLVAAAIIAAVVIWCVVQAVNLWFKVKSSERRNNGSQAVVQQSVETQEALKQLAATLSQGFEYHRMSFERIDASHKQLEDALIRTQETIQKSHTEMAERMRDIHDRAVVIGANVSNLGQRKASQ